MNYIITCFCINVLFLLGFLAYKSLFKQRQSGNITLNNIYNNLWKANRQTVNSINNIASQIRLNDYTLNKPVGIEIDALIQKEVNVIKMCDDVLFRLKITDETLGLDDKLNEAIKNAQIQINDLLKQKNAAFLFYNK